MISLPKSELQEMTRALIFANTPKSLLRGLLKSRALLEFREKCPAEDLREYYDRLTERGERTPFIAALAYCVLIALLTKPDTEPQVDATRLSWGPAIADYVMKGFANTERRIFTSGYPKPTFTSSTGELPSSPVDGRRGPPSIIVSA